MSLVRSYLVGEPGEAAAGGPVVEGGQAFFSSDPAVNAWSKFGSPHAYHVLMNGGAGWNGTDAVSFFTVNGGRWRNIGCLAGNATDLQYYYENGADGDNRPVWTMATGLDTLDAATYSLISVYHFATAVWVCQDGVLLTFSGTWASGQNADSATDQTDHIAGTALPGTTMGDIYSNMHTVATDGAWWVTSDMPTENAAAIQADALAHFTGWRLAGR